MKSIIICISFILPVLCFSQIKSANIQIEESVIALPESMRENSTVIGYNAEGERVN